MARITYITPHVAVKPIRRLRQSTRRIAYHLDYGFHGYVEPARTPGWYRFYLSENHPGWVPPAAALVISESEEAA